MTRDTIDDDFARLLTGEFEFCLQESLPNGDRKITMSGGDIETPITIVVRHYGEAGEVPAFVRKESQPNADPKNEPLLALLTEAKESRDGKRRKEKEDAK